MLNLQTTNMIKDALTLLDHTIQNTRERVMTGWSRRAMTLFMGKAGPRQGNFPVLVKESSLVR